MSKELAVKISDIQSRLKAPKSQYNKFGQYAYRNQEDILEAVKPLLKEHNLFQTISDKVICIGGRIYVEATVVVSDGENFVTNSAQAREPEEQKGMAPPQITGSASSYARKYALNGMYAIDDTKDADATNDHGKSASAPAKETPRVESSVLNPSKENLDAAKIAQNKETPKATGGRFTPKNKAVEKIVEHIDNGNVSTSGGWD